MVWLLLCMVCIGCSAGDAEQGLDAMPGADMGDVFVSDMPGVPEADPGLIARSGEVDSRPFATDISALFIAQDQELVWRAPSDEITAAVAIDAQSWLVIAQGKLSVLDVQSGVLSDSVIRDYVVEQQALALARVVDAQGSVTIFIQTDAGLHMWRGEALSKLEPTLHPTDMTPDGEGNLWVATPGEVMTLSHDGEALRRRMVFSDQGGDQIVALQGAMVLRQGTTLFVREQDATQWFEVVGVKADLILGHLWAPDLWWRDVQGGTGHLYSDYMGSATGVLINDGAVVDAYGRLITWDEGSGVASRHDRVHRVIVEPTDEVLTLPASIGVFTSFADRIDRIEATLDGEPLSTGMPQDVAMTADVLLPVSVGGGTHRLEVKVYFTGVMTPALAVRQLDAEPGDVSWSEHIDPIFKRACASCHGVQNVYQLDSAMRWQEAPVPAGSSMGSFEYIFSWLESGNMPPGDLPKLTTAEIALLEQWRDQGFKE
jgi:hypothetical protein